jgi:hypothetical protein
MRTAPPIPKPPSENAARFVIALALALPSLTLLLGLGTSGAVVATFLFVSLGALGVRTFGIGRAAQRTHAALQAITRGSLDEAESHLDAIPRFWKRSGSVRRSVAFQRALMAFYRGDCRACADLAASAIGGRTHLGTHGHEKMQETLGRALRALAHASLGENERVAADVLEVVTSPYASPEALARARLAETIVLARRGDDAKLAEHVRAHAPMMLEHAAPRERVLARALKKMAQVRARSIYREPAKRTDEGPADPLASWLTGIAPEAAPFVDTRAPLADRAPPAPMSAPTAEGMAAVARSRATAAKSVKGPGRRVLAMWAALVVLMLAFVQVLSPTEVHRPGHPVRTVPPDTAFVALTMLFAFAIFGGLLWQRVRSIRRLELDLFAAQLALATGDLAKAEPSLARLARLRVGLGAPQALYLQARHAERLARFDESLARSSDALASIGAQLHGVRATAALALTPTILAQRAVALAALGREGEAIAELATVATQHSAFAYRAVAEHRVRLIAAVRRGDLDAARRVASERSAELAIPLRDEVLGDLVLALAPSGASAEEQVRVDAELRESAELRAWVEAIGPGLANELARRAGARLAPPTERTEPADEDDGVSATAPSSRGSARL